MADLIDELAYRFWSIHPKDIPEPVGMPEGYKGGARAWFYANEMRRIVSLPAQGVRVKAHVNETAKSEHDAGDVLTDETVQGRGAAIAKMVKVAATQLWGEEAAKRVSYSVRYGDEAATEDTGCDLIRRKDALAACGITHSARYAEQTIAALPPAPDAVEAIKDVLASLDMARDKLTAALAAIREGRG